MSKVGSWSVVSVFAVVVLSSNVVEAQAIKKQATTPISAVAIEQLQPKSNPLVPVQLGYGAKGPVSFAARVTRWAGQSSFLVRWRMQVQCRDKSFEYFIRLGTSTTARCC